MAERRKKKPARSHDWSFRLAGVALCAFFALGLFAGLTITRRAGGLAAWHWRPGRTLSDALSPAGSAPVAILARADGFYALDPSGALRGPLSPGAIADLPVLSGSTLAGAASAVLLEDAALAVRAEAMISRRVSEMRVNSDRTAVLYLEHPPTELIVDLDRSAPEFSRAAALIRRWGAHLELVEALDLTTPGQAVMRLRRPLLQVLDQLGAPRAAKFQARRPRELASR